MSICTLTWHWLDVAFDILYVGDTSVIHESLKERHKLLQNVVKPLMGRLEILVPNGGLNNHRSSGNSVFKICLYVLFNSRKLIVSSLQWLIRWFCRLVVRLYVYIYIEHIYYHFIGAARASQVKLGWLCFRWNKAKLLSKIWSFKELNLNFKFVLITKFDCPSWRQFVHDMDISCFSWIHVVLT